MTPIVVSVGGLVGASANIIAHSQTPGGAGNLTLTASPYVQDTPREVLITTTADETAKTFTIKGTDWAGSPISEVITGVNNSTVASVLSYATVTSIAVSAALAGAITVGTNGVASSPWVRFDSWAGPSISKQCDVSGTVNYTVQTSMDDPNAIQGTPVNPNAMNWVSDADTAFVGATATMQGSWSFIPLWARVLLNSGSGTVTTTFAQAQSVIR